MAKQLFRYFFSYVEYTKGEPFFFGNCSIDLHDRITGYESLGRVQDELEKQKKAQDGKEKQIVIMSYQLMV